MQTVLLFLKFFSNPIAISPQSRYNVLVNNAAGSRTSASSTGWMGGCRRAKGPCPAMLGSQPPKQGTQSTFGSGIVRISTPTSSKETEAFFMPKIHSPAAAATVSTRTMTTRTLVFCALLAAMQVVLARLIVPMPAADVRFSIEAVPVFLAGALFGPVPGALVGFGSDMIGCLFSGYGYNPLFALPPILYGLCGGVFRGWLSRKTSFFRILLAFLPAVVLGSILYQSAALTYVYSKDGVFMVAFLTRLAARSLQFALTLVVEAAVTDLLFRSRIFHRVGLWPAKTRKD